MCTFELKNMALLSSSHVLAFENIQEYCYFFCTTVT